MTVVVITHPACLAHDPGPGHPESPARLRAVLAALDAPAFAPLHRRSAPRATLAQLARAHSEAYVAAILAAEPSSGHAALDGDTLLNPGSVEAAMRAAGAAVAGVDAVLSGAVSAAFAAVRPPGHHAEPDRAMGFCLFNSVAVAALHARDRWGLERIAVLDFDVHHGNGTQARFAADPTLFYGSTHQSPCYPGTGSVREHGIGHNIVNRPLPPGTRGPVFRAAWAEILACLRDFGPELLIVSAGFDAHRADPLAQLELDEADFAWLTARLLEAGGGRLVSVLEGGYDLPALAACVAGHVRVLLEQDGLHG